MAGKSKVSMRLVMDIVDSSKEADRNRLQHVSLAILVDLKAERSLIMALKEALLPEHGNADVRVTSLGDNPMALAFQPDLCVVIAGGSDDLVSGAVGRYARWGVPVAIVAESVLDAPEPTLPPGLERLVTIIVSSNYPTLLSHLARWMVGSTSKATAFAANFPFCRRERVRSLVRACASQNAAIGARKMENSDVTSMTTNQVKMALEIAASYGRPLTKERAQEIAGVVSAGMGYRSIARAATTVVPGLGWAMKAGIGYAGTVATANALTSHFEREDAGLPPLPRVRALASKAGSAAVSTLPTALRIGRTIVGTGRAIAALGEGDQE